MTLLQQRDQQRLQQRLELYHSTRHQLRVVLHELLPGREVLLFGSLTRPGAFHAQSDIDLALPDNDDTNAVDPICLAGLISERMNRPVDVVRVSRCRFAKKIRAQGEPWTL